MTQANCDRLLISTHYQVLEQFKLLTRDIERNKWDAGVVVMLNNGQLDIRGLGEVKSTAQACGLLFAAFKTLPASSQAEMLEALSSLLDRSKLIADEAEHWNSVLGLK